MRRQVNLLLLQPLTLANQHVLRLNPSSVPSILFLFRNKQELEVQSFKHLIESALCAIQQGHSFGSCEPEILLVSFLYNYCTSHIISTYKHWILLWFSKFHWCAGLLLYIIFFPSSPCSVRLNCHPIVKCRASFLIILSPPLWPSLRLSTSVSFGLMLSKAH